MSFVDVVTVQYSAGGAPALSTSWSTTGVGRVAYSGVIPTGTYSSGQEVDLDFLDGEVAQVYLVSTQNLTIHVNSDGSPAQTINLTANVPILSNPFTVNVASLYLRNLSNTTNASVTLLVLTNASSS
jgi:hypothetical protein